MTVQKMTLETVVNLSRHLSRFEQLRLISVLSETLSHDIKPQNISAETSQEQNTEAQLLADLQAAGMLVEPTVELRERVAEYDARYSPEEQAEILAELRSLHLDPPLSEIVTRAREFRPGWRWIVEEHEQGSESWETGCPPMKSTGYGTTPRERG